MNSLKARYKDVTSVRAEFNLLRTRQLYYEQSDRPNRLLALRLKQSERLASVDAVKDPSGVVITQPPLVNNVFREFYSELYKSETPDDLTDMHAFLSPLELPSLSTEEANQLDAPLTLEELRSAAVSMTRHKSPGLDGIPPELFVELWDLVGPLLVKSIQHSLDVGYFHRDQRTALISLLLKTGKDPLDCGNYRPLSLLNSDIKIYAKVLSNRLNEYIFHLVHEDQTGFIRGRLASDNVRRLLHVIDAPKDEADSYAVFSLDAMKAFDRLEWRYLWTVLRRFGFGDTFIHMVQTLYNKPTACVSTGHKLSSQFCLERGTRQGCPLSPILFALSLEPLAQAVRQSPLISPIHIKNTTHHISLYADDIILYLSDITNSVPQALALFQRFGSFSGYKINWSKSILMPLDSTPPHFNPPVSSPIQIQTTGFTYLGVSIHPSLSQVCKHNFNVMLQKIKNDLNRWSPLQISVCGRISVLKMNILPRVNFLFSAISLTPPPHFFRDIDRLCSNFIWNNKRSKIRLKTLQLPKLYGGLAVPNFKHYFWAFQLRFLKIWFDPFSKISWRSIEQGLVHPLRLQDLPFSGITQRSSLLRLGPIINCSLEVWKQSCKFLGYNHKFNKSSLIWHNKHLLTLYKPFVLPSWSDKNIHTLNYIFDSDGLHSFQDICNLHFKAKHTTVLDLS